MIFVNKDEILEQNALYTPAKGQNLTLFYDNCSTKFIVQENLFTDTSLKSIGLPNLT